MPIADLAVLVIVFSGLVVVAYVLFELTPFAHHTNAFRDRGTGKRQYESPHLETWTEFEPRAASPHLETWTEFEQRTHDNLN